ncbi:MAG TPA: AAA family ATPase [Firmicutes bacterium]|nr:AAA family ATPase [Bacillota bacterium]
MQIQRNSYLKELILRMNNGLVKVITGIRRCGKSYLLNNIFYNYLLSIGIKDEQIIKISLDDLENLPLLDAQKLNEYIKSKLVLNKQYYLFLDEIQEVKNFIPLLNGLMKISNLDIYVTGSNSKFLSKDIITEFRGRGDQIHVNPLSFREYFYASNKDFYEALDEYLTYGGMPFILSRETPKMKMEYLINLYNEIYLKDIKERYSIKNDAELNELLDIVSSSVGSLTNSSKLENTFKSIKNVSISRNTIESYLNIFEESFLINCSLRYDVKGKKYIGTPKKYYFTDLGLRNARLHFRQTEKNHLMENMIYNELKYRGYLVDIGVVTINEKNESGAYVRKQTEVDFVVNNGDKRFYIQSAYEMPSLIKENQETRPLLNIGDSFKKIVIVNDNISQKINDQGIVFIGLKEFLLNDNLLEQ